MKINQEKIWAGTEESLSAALEANDGISARLAAGNYQENEDGDGPRLLEIADGVAVVSIKGSLNNDEGMWNEMFGMTGYPEIREAMLAAANDTSVKQILLDIDSGGGAVSGCEDTAKLVRLINNQVKPVTAFTDGTMASAAYWLGSSAGAVYSGKTAVSGSIGVISTHMERSQQLKDAGIGVTVVRAGKFKALANSVEKLTADGKAQIQQVVDAAYGIFVDHVAEMRGKSYEYTDNTMAQGREFIGQASVDAGLVDGISTFDQVMGALKEKVIDSSRNSMDNRGKNSLRLSGETSITLSGDTDMAKKALTAQDIAAIAAGAVIGASTEAVVVADEVVVDAAIGTGGGEGAATLPNGDGVTSDVVAVVEAAKEDKTSATVQLLSAQLKEKDADLIQAHIKIAKLEEASAEAVASQAPLMQIAAQSISNMAIAMNGSAFNVEGQSASAVLAEHARLTEQFTSKFKAGGVAAVISTEASKQQEVQIDPRHTARVNAARFNK